MRNSSDALFRVIAENLVDLVALMDLEGRIVFASPSVEQLLGRAANLELDVVHPEDRERVRAWWVRIVGGQQERITYRVLDREGAWRSLESSATRVVHEDQPHVLASSRDVSDHVRTVAALRDSEAKLAEAERIAHLGYWENDLVADRITWSDETYRILGLEPGERIADAALMRERIHPDDRAIQAEASARALQGDGRYDGVYRVVRDDGDVRTVHSVGEVVRDASGEPVRAFGVVQDITERKRAEEERAVFRSLIDHTNDALEVIDPESGRILDVNEQACVAHGYTRAEYLELTVRDIAPNVAERPWAETCANARRASPRVFESQHRRKDGSVFPVEINMTFVQRDREYLLAIVRDITERKRAESDLRRSEERLREAQKMEAIGRLASGVAHDFNNLLTVINGNMDLIVANLDPAHPLHELLDDVRDAGERGIGLTQQLLAFCRRQPLAPRVIELNALLGKSQKLLRRAVGEHVELTLVESREPAHVTVDSGQLEQAILNLAVNARDAMPAGGKLTIETRKADDDSVLVIVSDSGEGMNEATRARIFEPFFTTKSPGQGTGLGLALVHAFVEQSGGRIDVESEQGHGTSFVIRLPRAAAPADEARPPQPESAPGRETVLLVEDEDAVRTYSRRVLQERGYTVLDARDGSTAVAVSRGYSATINLLLTDIGLPHMSGREVADVLRRERPEMRVLLMSGRGGEPDGVVEANLPFLQKPFRPGELARTVRNVLDAVYETDVSLAPRDGDVSRGT